MKSHLNIHRVNEKKNMLFSSIKLNDYSQIWWERYTMTLMMEGDPIITT
jgi:GTP-dependent phosphoenolpyruvate carboxykinase